jgi:hypothetical protein
VGFAGHGGDGPGAGDVRGKMFAVGVRVIPDSMVGKKRLDYWSRWFNLVNEKPELKPMFNEALDIFDEYEKIIASHEQERRNDDDKN